MWLLVASRSAVHFFCVPRQGPGHAKYSFSSFQQPWSSARNSLSGQQLERGAGGSRGAQKKAAGDSQFVVPPPVTQWCAFGAITRRLKKEGKTSAHQPPTRFRGFKSGNSCFGARDRGASQKSAA
jgi:hypothetical protein